MNPQKALKTALAMGLTRLGKPVSWLTNDLIFRDGIWMDVSSRSIPDEVRCQLFFRFYESSERRAVSRFLPRDTPCIELGASIGYMSNLIARTSGYAPQVSVEANPKLVKILKRNLALNCSDQVEVIHAAVSYSGATSVPFALSDDSLCGHLASKAGTGESVDVPTVRLGDIVARRGFDRFALICDIEGAEVELLHIEDAATMDRCVLAIFELHATSFCERRWTRPEVAAEMAKRWNMRPVFTDTKVWVFRREP